MRNFLGGEKGGTTGLWPNKEVYLQWFHMFRYNVFTQQWVDALLVHRGEKNTYFEWAYQYITTRWNRSYRGWVCGDRWRKENNATVHSEQATGFIRPGWTAGQATVKVEEADAVGFSEDRQELGSSPDWAPCPRSPWHTGKWCDRWRICQSRQCYGSPSWSTL